MPSTQQCPLDIEDGLARAGGERDFYRELLDLFLEDTPQRLSELREAVAAGDSQRLASVAHGIKGAAANLSALSIRECALRLETKGREGVTAGTSELADELEREVQRLAEFVTTF